MNYAASADSDSSTAQSLHNAHTIARTPPLLTKTHTHPVCCCCGRIVTLLLPLTENCPSLLSKKEFVGERQDFVQHQYSLTVLVRVQATSHFAYSRLEAAVCVHAPLPVFALTSVLSTKLCVD